MMPNVVRRAALPFLPPMRRMRGQYETAYRLAGPVLKAREEAAKHPEYIKPNDLMQWITETAELEGGSYSIRHQAGLQLSAGLASIWSTSKTCTHALYDLASRPEYISLLREEIDEALAEDHGYLTRAGLGKMAKLDSFMKESQRHNVASFGTYFDLFLSAMSTTDELEASWDRQIQVSVTLKDGTHIPKDTYLAVPVSNEAADPCLADPERFDGMRFYSMRRSGKENSSKHQFTSTERYSLHFGYGKHACPGRFLASTEIKAILVLILKDYDIRLNGGSRIRPGNWIYGLHMVRVVPF